MTAMRGYNYGMQYVRDAVGGKMFVSLSIAPLFPGGEYAHSRRVSCDAAGSIKEIEYMLNSVTYGWWLDKYYRYNDGDLVVVGRNTANEAVSRVTASAIAGMFLDSDALAGNPSVQDRARDLLTRPPILAVARMGKTFRPVENNTGDRATDEFVYRKGSTWYLAVFNYQQEPVTKHIDLARAGLSPGTRYRITDLWNGTSFAALDNFSVNLEGAQAALFSLEAP
jgi:alpha-galactosidase